MLAGALPGTRCPLVDIDYHGGLTTCSLGYDDLYYDATATTLFDVSDFDQMESVNNRRARRV